MTVGKMNVDKNTADEMTVDKIFEKMSRRNDRKCDI